MAPAPISPQAVARTALVQWHPCGLPNHVSRSFQASSPFTQITQRDPDHPLRSPHFLEQYTSTYTTAVVQPIDTAEYTVCASLHEPGPVGSLTRGRALLARPRPSSRLYATHGHAVVKRQDATGREHRLPIAAFCSGATNFRSAARCVHFPATNGRFDAKQN